MKAGDSVDLLVLAAFWGASFLFMRVAGPEFGPIALVQLRLGTAALFLLPIFLLRIEFSELTTNWRKLTLLGVLNSAMPFLLLTYATLTITGGFAAILNATAPIWAALIAWIWLSDRLTTSGIVGILVGFAGVFVLVGDTVSLALPGSTNAAFAVVLASFLYGVGGNFVRKYMHGLKPLTIATGSQLAAAIVMLPASIAYWPDNPISLRAWLAVVIMGIVSTGLAYILYFRLIANIGPTKAITVTYLVPAFAMVWGVLLIDELVTADMIIGCLIIFFGTTLATGVFQKADTR